MNDGAVCKYHSREPSIWRCDHCQVPYCRKCIPGSQDNYGVKGARCPLCDAPLTYLGAANTAEPFWKIPHTFFIYPFQKNTLIILGLVIVAGLIARTGFLGVIFSVFMFVGLVRYCLKILQHQSDGDREAPPLSELGSKSEEYTFLKVAAISMVFGFLTKLAAGVSPWLGAATGFLFNLMLPASLIILSQTHSMLEAINPLKILSIILKIGSSYLILLVVVVTVLSGPGFLLSLFGKSLSPIVLLPTVFFLFTYFSFVIYAMMGYVIYEKQAELGFSASFDDNEYYLDENDFKKEKLFAHANIYFHEGRYAQAQDILLSNSDTYREDLAYNDKLHRLFMALNDLESLNVHSNFYAELLVKKGYAGKAMTIYLDTLTKIKDFQLDRAESCYEVANLLYQQAKYKSCLLLLNNFHKRFPDSMLTAKAYVISAKTFLEGFHDEPKARQLIDFVRRKYGVKYIPPEIDKLILK